MDIYLAVMMREQDRIHGLFDRQNDDGEFKHYAATPMTCH